MICPCCGQQRETPSVEELLSFRWSLIETTIVRNLARRYPAGMTVEELVSEVYGTRNSQPLTANMGIRTAIVRLRKKLAPLGWQIPRGKSGWMATGAHEHRLEKLP